ncbi:MAG: transglycosylase SLT domain-containing protein [Chloroflexota bacterium]
MPLQLVLIVGAIGLTAGLLGTMSLLLLRGNIQAAPLASANRSAEVPAFDPDQLGVVFTPEVQYWAPKIKAWAKQYNVDPNMLATVIQIESCGDYLAGSGAGAQGLFQVMPDHFADGEDEHDPNTNARAGITYLKGGLELADGHIGLAMAGYNGGWGVIDRGWGGWYQETRLYYVWGSQIYLDAIHGKTTAQSSALQNWLNSGGSRLCAQAAARIATPTPGSAQPTAAVPAVQPIQPIQPTIVILPPQ